MSSSNENFSALSAIERLNSTIEHVNPQPSSTTSTTVQPNASSSPTMNNTTHNSTNTNTPSSSSVPLYKRFQAPDDHSLLRAKTKTVPNRRSTSTNNSSSFQAVTGTVVSSPSQEHKESKDDNHPNSTKVKTSSSPSSPLIDYEASRYDRELRRLALLLSEVEPTTLANDPVTFNTWRAETLKLLLNYSGHNKRLSNSNENLRKTIENERKHLTDALNIAVAATKTAETETRKEKETSERLQYNFVTVQRENLALRETVARLEGAVKEAQSRAQIAEQAVAAANARLATYVPTSSLGSTANAPGPSTTGKGKHASTGKGNGYTISVIPTTNPSLGASQNTLSSSSSSSSSSTGILIDDTMLSTIDSTSARSRSPRWMIPTFSQMMREKEINEHEKELESLPKYDGRTSRKEQQLLRSRSPSAMEQLHRARSRSRSRSRSPNHPTNSNDDANSLANSGYFTSSIVSGRYSPNTTTNKIRTPSMNHSGNGAAYLVPNSTLLQPVSFTLTYKPTNTGNGMALVNANDSIVNTTNASSLPVTTIHNYSLPITSSSSSSVSPRNKTLEELLSEPLSLPDTMENSNGTGILLEPPMDDDAVIPSSATPIIHPSASTVTTNTKANTTDTTALPTEPVSAPTETNDEGKKDKKKKKDKESREEPKDVDTALPVTTISPPSVEESTNEGKSKKDKKEKKEKKEKDEPAAVPEPAVDSKPTVVTETVVPVPTATEPDPYDGMKSDALKAECEKRGLSTEGKRDDMRARLREDDSKKKAAAVVAAVVPEPVSAPVPTAPDAYESMKSDALKAECEKRGLSTDGKRDDMRARLREDDAKKVTVPATAPTEEKKSKKDKKEKKEKEEKTDDANVTVAAAVETVVTPPVVSTEPTIQLPNYDSMKGEELRAECEKRGLSTEGKRDDMRARLREDDAKKAAVVPKPTETVVDAPVPESDPYDGMKSDALKAECEKRGLSTEGKRDDMRTRLREDDSKKKVAAVTNIPVAVSLPAEGGEKKSKKEKKEKKEKDEPISAIVVAPASSTTAPDDTAIKDSIKLPTVDDETTLASVSVVSDANTTGPTNTDDNSSSTVNPDTSTTDSTTTVITTDPPAAIAPLLSSPLMVYPSSSLSSSVVSSSLTNTVPTLSSPTAWSRHIIIKPLNSNSTSNHQHSTSSSSSSSSSISAKGTLPPVFAPSSPSASSSTPSKLKSLPTFSFPSATVTTVPTVKTLLTNTRTSPVTDSTSITNIPDYYNESLASLLSMITDNKNGNNNNNNNNNNNGNSTTGGTNDSGNGSNADHPIVQFNLLRPPPPVDPPPAELLRLSSMSALAQQFQPEKL